MNTGTPRAPMVVLGATCLALAGITALDARVITTVHNLSLSLPEILSATTPRWLMMAAALPLLFHIAWRRPPWPVTASRVALHVALFLALATVYSSVQSAFILHAPHMGARIGFAPPGMQVFSNGLPTVGFMYGVILLTAWGIAQSRERHVRELRAAQLESQLQTARLGALRAQLHPHFLYNTLNGIAAVVSDREPQRAVHAIEQLAELLHASFREDGREVISLAEEVALTERYLALQQLRFGERLAFSVDVEPRVADCQVPILMLQPAVENAIRHGMAGRREPMHVHIAARASGDMMHIVVENDGEKLPADWSPTSRGLGLANTRARLATTFGDDASLTVAPRDGAGVTVTFRVPRRPGAPTADIAPRAEALQPA